MPSNEKTGGVGLRRLLVGLLFVIGSAAVQAQPSCKLDSDLTGKKDRMSLDCLSGSRGRSRSTATMCARAHSRRLRDAADQRGPMYCQRPTASTGEGSRFQCGAAQRSRLWMMER